MSAPLPNGPLSPLRQKLIDDMSMRHFSVATQRNYIRDVGRFASFLRRPPDTATSEDVGQFQLTQIEAGVPVPTMNSMVSALRFFFANMLDRPGLARKLRVSRARNLPVVLSRDGVERLLNATTSLKHEAAQRCGSDRHTTLIQPTLNANMRRLSDQRGENQGARQA